MSRQEFEKRFPGDEACARQLAELRWTSLRARRLADTPSAEGHPVSELTVNRMLHSLTRLQLAVQPRDGGRSPASGPRRAVPAHVARLRDILGAS
ncbi:MAG: hypothetical protein F4145_03550 [Boseongicola sp. SB0675_bin_26]|nr:hypothetical protein [Boseongicola sp. SB0675_bin_26]